MSALDKIAYALGRRDEVPNQALARELAEAADAAGLREVAEGLQHKNQNIRSDCLKVLYEVSYLRPELVAAYVEDFLKLLHDKRNRMVWGAMIALAGVAPLRPKEIWQQIDTVIDVTDRGTVITTVWGVRALARVAAADARYRRKLLPVLLAHVQKCLPRDVPLHAESMLGAVDQRHQAEFLVALEARQPEMSAAQLARLKKVLKRLT